MKKYRLIYDLNGTDAVYGYAYGTDDLVNLVNNALFEGIDEFRVERM